MQFLGMFRLLPCQLVHICHINYYSSSAVSLKSKSVFTPAPLLQSFLIFIIIPYGLSLVHIYHLFRALLHTLGVHIGNQTSLQHLTVIKHVLGISLKLYIFVCTVVGAHTELTRTCECCCHIRGTSSSTKLLVVHVKMGQFTTSSDLTFSPELFAIHRKVFPLSLICSEVHG